MAMSAFYLVDDRSAGCETRFQAVKREPFFGRAALSLVLEQFSNSATGHS